MGSLILNHPLGLIAMIAGYVLLVVEMCIPGFGVPGVAGTVLMLRPWQSAAALIRLMGISLAAEGALSLCVALCAVKTVRYRQLDPYR